MDSIAIDSRRQRGMALVKDKGARIRHIMGAKYLVPSASSSGAGYVVDVDAGSCSCPDHETRGVRCKHTFAVEFFRSEETRPDGTTVITNVVRLQYPPRMGWSEYNASQCEEKEVVESLLRQLCDGITEPVQTKGRPRTPLRHSVYAAAMKVYGCTSARRADTDIRRLQGRGLIDHAPDWSSVCHVIERADLTPLFSKLVEESAMPLVGIERTFAIDSTGFGVKAYERWFDAKYPRDKKEAERVMARRKCKHYVKAHAMIGCLSNVITSMRVTGERGRGAGDSPNLLPLVNATAANGFELGDVTADAAYLGHKNIAGIERAGGTPIIDWKENSRDGGSRGWERMRLLWKLNREEYQRRYGPRSNVEATFSSLKRKFGGFVRSKKLEAQINEVLLKALVFNLSMLVHAIHELEIDPKFWQPAVGQ